MSSLWQWQQLLGVEDTRHIRVPLSTNFSLWETGKTYFIHMLGLLSAVHPWFYGYEPLDHSPICHNRTPPRKPIVFIDFLVLFVLLFTIVLCQLCLRIQVRAMKTCFSFVLHPRWLTWLVAHLFISSKDCVTGNGIVILIYVS